MLSYTEAASTSGPKVGSLSLWPSDLVAVAATEQRDHFHRSNLVKKHGLLKIKWRRMNSLATLSYFIVRPNSTTPLGSVQSQGSPAAPKPYGQVNRTTLHSRSVSWSIRRSKNPVPGFACRSATPVLLEEQLERATVNNNS
jgi:hypothetical protein